MKTISLRTGRFALTGVAAAAIVLMSSSVMALGLGRLAVQSSLGEPLRADIDVTSITPEEAGSLRVRIAPADVYKAAGVDYNGVLSSTQATLLRRPDGRPYLQLSSDRAVQEPFVDVILEMSWSSGRLVREFTLLFDPPSAPRAAAPAPAVAPALSAAPIPAPAPAATSGETAPAKVGRAGRSGGPSRFTPAAPAPAPAPAPAAAATEGGDGADQYQVRSGDTLARIASRTQRPGVSLDQMLVGLYRGNPQAFIDNNMNRLKSGVVLQVPSADSAKQLSPTEAHQIIQAQSADFGAYRQRLASGVTDAKTEAPTRQASGKVESSIDDRKQSAAPTPDKLRLSQGAVKASAPEGKVSAETEKKDSATRIAELQRNVDDLKKLQGAASAPTVAAAPAPAPVATPAPAPQPSLPAIAAPAPVVAASAPEPVASAAEPIPAPAPVTASAPEPVASAAPKPMPALPPLTKPEEPSSGSLFDNPIVLAGVGALIALFAGLAVYRLRKAKQPGGETSFLESRLQPDSFFGASGGQRIDTRDATGASSSMSYSLSQLDAIGDVDPVAEADVYLAYGRDLQAEEILKEAMRANPERLAIRSKLLEVYAKRRDSKGFESLASQLLALTHGEGEEWAKAQELGLTLDPENPLYQPGAQPGAAVHAAEYGEPMMGGHTAPQPMEAGQASDLDLDLDIGTTADAPAPASEMSFDLPSIPEAAETRAPAPAAGSMDFDLSDITLEINDGADTVAPAAAASADMDESVDGGPSDPLARKLELAEEFRQIGDMEGARDLLEEVIAKASGVLKTKAQGMLNQIA